MTTPIMSSVNTARTLPRGRPSGGRDFGSTERPRSCGAVHGLFYEGEPSRVSGRIFEALRNPAAHAARLAQVDLATVGPSLIFPANVSPSSFSEGRNACSTSRREVRQSAEESPRANDA